jgi:hypothetical protein
MDVATWKLPTGISANPDALKVDRMRNYRFDMIHQLKDGTRIIPNLQTIVDILYAYDSFGGLITVAITEDSYTVYSD